MKTVIYVELDKQELEDIIVALDYYHEDIYERNESTDDFDEMDDIPNVLRRVRTLAEKLMDDLRSA